MSCPALPPALVLPVFDPSCPCSASLFRYLSSSELRSRTRQAMLQETTFGVVLESGKLRFVDDVREGGVKRGAAIRATGFVEMVEPIAHLLPDMMFALNAFAEVGSSSPSVTYDSCH